MNSTEYENLISQMVTKMTNYTDLINFGAINYGATNKWEGISRFEHQIDVSLDNRTDILLVECKYWKDNVPIEAILTLWARMFDISQGPKGKDRRVRGALVTSKEFQSGVYTFAESNYYRTQLSLFVVRDIDEFVTKFHRHFINVEGFRVSAPFGKPDLIRK